MRLPPGRYNRMAAGRMSRRFCPTSASENLLTIEPQLLWDSGKRLILLDADNTLLPWRSEEIPETSRLWVSRAQAIGFKIVLVSNTRNQARLQMLAKELNVTAAVGKFKPSRSMFQFAMQQTGATPEEVVMIGDQIFTDVLGANRSGVDSILVHPLAEREFIGTKFNRLLEKVITRRLLHTMQSEEDDLPIVKPQGIFQRRIVRQFAKFCVVGGLSFLIDYNIRMTLQFAVPYGGGLLSDHVGNVLMQARIGTLYARDAASAFFPIASLTGGVIALLNSFFWNRKWTFRIAGAEERAAQFRKFVIISVSGILLNTLISGIVFNLMHLQDDKVGARVATVLATGIVAFWNFFGQRLYAFKKDPK